MFSDGAGTVDIRILFPLRMSCVQRMDESARKRASLQGIIIWIESGVIIGLVESRDEYQESKRRRLMMTLLVDSTLLQAFHRESTSGTYTYELVNKSFGHDIPRMILTASKRLMSRS